MKADILLAMRYKNTSWCPLILLLNFALVLLAESSYPPTQGLTPQANIGEPIPTAIGQFEISEKPGGFNPALDSPVFATAGATDPPDPALMRSGGFRRAFYNYRIPGSTTNIHVIFDTTAAVTQGQAMHCLTGASHIASLFPGGALVNPRFRYPAQPANGTTFFTITPHFSFIASLMANSTWGAGKRLSYSDVLVVIKTLQGWFTVQQDYGSLIFYIEDHHRGALGRGLLQAFGSTRSSTETTFIGG